MHPDLQRKLIRLTRDRFAQCIIATHSVEIMGEPEPSNILIIDKKRNGPDPQIMSLPCNY
jgi:predicted ATPase